jgi:hypothetical protein
VSVPDFVDRWQAGQPELASLQPSRQLYLYLRVSGTESWQHQKLLFCVLKLDENSKLKNSKKFNERAIFLTE